MLGFALGLVITFGIWSANRALKEKETAEITEVTAEEDTQTPKITPIITSTAFSLAVISPEDESLQNKDKIPLSGTTEPGSVVAILTENNEYIIEADGTGKFETEIPLVAGTNEITIIATNINGDEATKTINVVYTTVEI